MATVTIEEARAMLDKLIHDLTPGEELVITKNDRPVEIGRASCRL